MIAGITQIKQFTPAAWAKAENEGENG